MIRRGFSLVEVMLALALLSVLALPAIVLLRAHDTPLSPATVQARRLADRLVAALADLDPDELDALDRSTAGGGFARFDPAKVAGITAADVDGLTVIASVRMLRHVEGRFGLDRLDLRVAYPDGARTQTIARTVVRRNASALSALARVRLHGDVEQLSDSELADGLEYAAYQDGLDDRAGFVDGSPYPARLYPPLLAEFEPPEDGAALAEARKRTEALGDRLRGAAYAAGGNAPRPHFDASVGVAH